MLYLLASFMLITLKLSDGAGSNSTPQTLNLGNNNAVRVLIITAQDNSTEVKKCVEEYVDEELESKKLEDKYFQEHISCLDQEKIDKIKSLEKSNHVKITINKSEKNSYILVEGLKASVQAVTEKIQEIFRDLDKAAIRKRETELNAKKVQWKYIHFKVDGDVWEAFPNEKNFSIEEAFGKQKNWKDPDRDLVIDFTGISGENVFLAKDSKSKEVTRIHRRDLQKDPTELPCTWTDLEQEEVDLPSTHKDYQIVEKKVLNDVPDRQVVSIKRIQNKRCYIRFKHEESIMEKRLGNNTCIPVRRELWHGTSKDTLKKINTNGFNRSYAGKNMTKYGKGCYFACKASYSVNKGYSEIDTDGHQHVYLVLVLTGEYTEGSKDIPDAPFKDPTGGDPTVYDSTVDDMDSPSMFVTFRDYRAYPEYLITLKKK